MNQSAKRILSFVLCLVMLAGLMPAFAIGTSATENAADSTEETIGAIMPELTIKDVPAPEADTIDVIAPIAPITDAVMPGEDTIGVVAPEAPITDATEPAEDTVTAVVPEEDAADVEATEETTEPAGDNVAAPLANNADGTTTVPGSVTNVENAYVLADSLSNNGTYLIVTTNAAGSGYALLNNNGFASSEAVTVQQGDKPYILLDNANAVWTATGANTSWAFANNGRYLNWTASSNSGSYSYSLSMSTTSANWTLGSNTLYSYLRRSSYSSNYSNYYLVGGSSWSMSRNNAAKVYFYTPGTATVTIPDVTYGVTVSANGTTNAYTAKYITSDSTLALGTAFWSNPTGYETNVNGGTYTWTSSDATVATVDGSGNLDFTGKAGSTTIRVTYTQGEYVIWDEIVITAEPAAYQMQIVDGEKNSLDGTISVKGETAIAAGLDLNALVTYQTSATTNAELSGATVTWSVTDETIATIDADGKMTFTGEEGVVTVTAVYTDPYGNVHTDTLNVSVSNSLYFTPNDGTNNFPEYPNEGAVRIDKTAQAVGNFSQTGVAKVELSMTGVPYSAGNEIDVVIMIDMSTSMTEESNGVADRVTPARNSAVNALEAIVQNEDDTINNNRVAVYTFNGYDRTNPQNYANAVDEVLSLQSYQNSSNTSDLTKLTNAKGNINTAIQEDETGSGTNYGAALEKCYSVLKAAKEEYPQRKQFVIFVTDGEPTTGFAYENPDGTVSDDGYNSSYNNGAADKYYTYTEYYSKQMRTAGVEVYAVGIQLTNTNANTILKKIGGNSTGTAYANASTHGDYAQFIDADESADKLVEIFENIVNATKEAATDVTVTDKVADEYTLILADPANVTTGATYSIDVTEYTLDANKNRVLPGKVIETVSLTDTDKVTVVDGKITSINADTFTYDAATHTFVWKANKLDTKELALSYYVYLNESAGYPVEEQTPAGTYPTNDYAHITYTNHLDNPCQKYFPVPQLTWNGAQVSYTFYLVNAQGQPVNRAGRVVPFAEAVYVTDVYTQSVTWDSFEGDLFNARMIASELLPDVYSLYDPNTTYTINVYEDETGKDQGNSFIIVGGSTSANADTYTTKVFNTKAGTIYSVPGTYTAANVYTGFDFANTTVAFAVVWNPALAEDTVVVDYGLDVVIDVATNDALDTKVVGVYADKPNAIINSGLIAAPAKNQEVTLAMGTASVENLTSVRFSLDKTAGMQFKEPVTFYYESQASYYQNNVKQEAYMYSSVTVIPATTIYYEDDFVTFKSYDVEQGAWMTDSTWSTAGTRVDAVQDQDRPGANKLVENLDADNVYGYDSAYTALSQYSMGSAAKVSVSAATSAAASFTFYGTGFDVVSMTSNLTGTIMVDVYKGNVDVFADGFDTAAAHSLVVDTYYGYTQNADGEWVLAPNNPNAVYQVPVMKVSGLEYGQYTVRISAVYSKLFDHNGNGTYDFYLDAIRVYDPTGNSNDVANDAYVSDNEGWPTYQELRNNIISATGCKITSKVNDDGIVEVTIENDQELTKGAIFIDSEDGNLNIADYVSYGPNNELYLAKGQAIAFNITTDSNVADVQLGIKVANGASVTCRINGDVYTVETTADLYYSIMKYVGQTIVIENYDDPAIGTDGGILSLTNIKVTHKTAPAAGTEAENLLWIDETTAAAALMSLRREPVADEPEATEPEATEPEATEPETTEPETEATEPETEVTEPETEATEPETEATEPTKPGAGSGNVGTVIRIIKKLFGWLFG